MRKAAERFVDAITISWDSPSPWEETAAKGLAAVDADALGDFCQDTDESFDEARDEVMEYIRTKVRSDQSAWREYQADIGAAIAGM